MPNELRKTSKVTGSEGNYLTSGTAPPHLRPLR